jgi:alpha-L-fucosidase
MRWWHDARFGMFVHWGLYSQLGRGEWVMNLDRIPI